jgi:hypothetical protein
MIQYLQFVHDFRIYTILATGAMVYMSLMGGFGRLMEKWVVGSGK